MIVDTLLVRLGGESGIDNAISAGDVLTLSVARSGYHVHTFRPYPAEIKGGPVMFQLRAGIRRVPSLGDKLDVLLAFNEEAWDLHHQALRPDGVLIYDPGEHDVPAGFEGTVYGIPLDRMAKDLNLRKGKNLIALGTLSALFGFDFQQLQATVKDMYGKKRPQFIESNRMALLAGYEWVKENVPGGAPFRLAASDGAQEPQLVMSGNQAIVAGALAAGCRYCGGYPITPASDILEQMAKRLPEVGGAALQTEDEIAAINMAIGASYAGSRAMAVMKHVGLNVAADPLITLSYIGVEGGMVICVADDPGMHSSQNEQDSRFYGKFAMIPVLEPATQQEAYEMSRYGFDLSEKFGLPVMLRITTRLAHSRSGIIRSETREENGMKLPGDLKQFILLPALASKRYKLLLSTQEKLEQESPRSLQTWQSMTCETAKVWESLIRTEIYLICFLITCRHTGSTTWRI